MNKKGKRIGAQTARAFKVLRVKKGAPVRAPQVSGGWFPKMVAGGICRQGIIPPWAVSAQEAKPEGC